MHPTQLHRPSKPACRYNLLSGDLCSPRMASLLAVGVPWAITAFTYNRGLLLTACNWVALLVQGYTNFVLPAALYLEALRRHKYPEEMEEEGLERLPSTRSMRRRRNPVVATIPEDEEYLGDLEERLLSEEDLIEVRRTGVNHMPSTHAVKWT